MKKNFCDMNPLFFAISTQKNVLKRKLEDFRSKEIIATTKAENLLPNLVSRYSSTLIKTGPGIDPELQENKAHNIKLASSKITNILIAPNEVFSFWKMVGIANKKKGYKAGRVIKQGKLISGTGGGLCNLANTINNVVLRSPLQITEFHKHSDALACDIGHRVPMANGTSISYNYIDYRFKNTTDQNVQLVLWCDEISLHAELRSETEFPYNYSIIEENHHFEKEKDKYYRVSQIYKTTLEKTTGEIIAKELIWDNHSLVMFDHSLIEKAQTSRPECNTQTNEPECNS